MAVVVNELDITWKEVAVAYFDVLFRQNGGSKEVKKKQPARTASRQGAISYAPERA